MRGLSEKIAVYSSAVIVILCLLGSSQAISRDLTAREKEAIENVVKNKLKDPFSAQFKWPDYLGGATYCGYVNAKNLYGGYVGFTRYLVTFAPKDKFGKPFAMFQKLSDVDPTTVDSQVVEVVCSDDGY